MKIFILISFISLCSCSGQKRKMEPSEDPQLYNCLSKRYLHITAANAFANLPDEMLQYILDFLPFNSQLSLSSVSSFWFGRLNSFWQKNALYSKTSFLSVTSFPSEVSFKELLKVIECFTIHWETLCRNSKDANFLNERPEIETSLGLWLSANMDQIISPEWNTPLNEEGDTFSYVIFQRLLLSPYFVFTIQHPIWDSMSVYNEIRVRAACDFFSQVPIVVGKSAFYNIGFIDERIMVKAIERGIELEIGNQDDDLIYSSVIIQGLISLTDTHAELIGLAHQNIVENILELESIVLIAIETGSTDIFENGFVIRCVMLDDENYATLSNSLIIDGFEVVQFGSGEKESYVRQLVPYLITKNPCFLPFLFKKALASQVQNQHQILMFLCSFIPEKFEYHQIDIAEIVSVLSSALSPVLLEDIFENFPKMSKESQVKVFKNVIKKKIDLIIFAWNEELEENNFAYLDQTIKDAGLFFNAAPPIFPFLYGSTQIVAENFFSLYLLARIGYLEDVCILPNSYSGRDIPADYYNPMPCKSRKLTLQDGSEVAIFCQAPQAQEIEDE